MKYKISFDEILQVFNSAKKQHIIEDTDNSVIFYSLNKLEERIRYLKSCFPNTVFHSIAIKSNPLVQILSKLNKLNVGLEAATFSEVKLATYTNFSESKIIFDSPVKTLDELKESLKLGIHINIDNLSEIDRIASLEPQKSKSTFGIRINPQVGAGKISSMSVAENYSKFGIPIKYYKKEIVNAFLTNSWLSGLHVHSGSQSLEIITLVKGIKIMYDLSLEINNELRKHNKENRIRIIDIGGGFPISYKEDEKEIDMLEYVNHISKECPHLFDNFKVITEFGRWIHGHNGWVVSKIEYLKYQPEFNTAFIHVGADMFLRECYNPDDWYHQISTISMKRKEKDKKSLKKYNIAGPLCFGGDILQKDVELSEINEGDFICIHDVGANTFNLWSRHCSREFPKIVGYTNESDFTILKEKESFEDILKFWM